MQAKTLVLYYTSSQVNIKTKVLEKHNLRKKKNTPEKALPAEEWESVRETLHRSITANLPKNQLHTDFTSFSMVGKDKRTGYEPSKEDFAHLHGDVFISKTGLEGSIHFRMMYLFQHYLKESAKESRWHKKQEMAALSNLIEKSLPTYFSVGDP